MASQRREENGENDCSDSFINGLMSWFDQEGIGYLGWAWDTYNCSTFPALITNLNGTPTAYGAGFKAHLIALAGSGSGPTPTPTSGGGGTSGVLRGVGSNRCLDVPGWATANGTLLDIALLILLS